MKARSRLISVLTAIAVTGLVAGCTGSPDSETQVVPPPSAADAVATDPVPELFGECPRVFPASVIHEMVLLPTGDTGSKRYIVTCADESTPASLVDVKPGHLVAWKQKLSTAEKVTLWFPGENPIFGMDRPKVVVELPYDEFAIYRVQDFAAHSDTGVRHTYKVKVGEVFWSNDTGPKIVVKNP